MLQMLRTSSATFDFKSALLESIPSSCTGRFHCGDGTTKNLATVLAGSVPLHWPVPLSVERCKRRYEASPPVKRVLVTSGLELSSRIVMPKSIHVDHHDTAHYIPMYHQTQNVTEREREIYKSLKNHLFHEGRVVDRSYLENQPNLRPTFAAIGFDCLLDINKKICLIFVLQFYKSVRLIYNLNGTLSIYFIIRNVKITLRLEEFARILHIPCHEACVFTPERAITSLPNGINSNPKIYPPPLEDLLLIRNALFDSRPPDDLYLVDHVMTPLSKRRVFGIMPGGKRPWLPTPTPTPFGSSESTASSSHQGEENDPVNNFTLDPIPCINQLLPI
ncbi:hypothetical protein Tco_0819941 [Tanacetum coccineum]|uniref:Uncharacterized protein n=1 Tax=Tanacetum coccineum TaxID=301880 RepID=A0ABQ5AAM3_9ASTR